MSVITTTKLANTLAGLDATTNISGDGRYIIYGTQWEVAKDDPRYLNDDIFRFDLQTGATFQITSQTAEHSRIYTSISDDGQQIAYSYWTDSRNDVLTGDIGAAGSDDHTMVSLNPAGKADNGFNTNAAISGDGKIVAFRSTATDLGDLPDRNDAIDIFVKNLQSGMMYNASTDNGGAQLNGDSGVPELSGDGHIVVFNNNSKVYAKNLLTGELILASSNAAGAAGNGYSGGNGDNGSHPYAVSEDGRYVVFSSYASNLVDNDTNDRVDVFRKDLLTGQVLRVSTDGQGQQLNHSLQDGGDVAMSTDGRYVAFIDNIATISGDSPGTNIYLKDLDSGAITHVVSDDASRFALSNDGHKLTYLRSGPPGSWDKDIMIVTIADDGGTINGTAGIDTAAYSGKRADYAIASKGGGVYTVAAKSVETLAGVERLHFADVNVALDGEGAAGQAYRLYQAAFNRVPDQQGLGFWIDQMDHGMTRQKAAEYFLASPEGQKLYGAAPSNADLVNSLYHNVLHRDGEADGITFWNNALDSRLTTQAGALAFFSDSPENHAALIGVIQQGMSYIPA